MSEISTDKDGKSISVGGTAEELDPEFKPDDQSNTYCKGESIGKENGTRPQIGNITDNKDQKKPRETPKVPNSYTSVDSDDRFDESERCSKRKTRSRSTSRSYNDQEQINDVLDGVPISEASDRAKDNPKGRSNPSKTTKTVKVSPLLTNPMEGDTEMYSKHNCKADSANVPQISFTERCDRRFADDQYESITRQIAEPEIKADEAKFAYSYPILIILILSVLTAVVFMISWSPYMEKPKLLSAIANTYQLHNHDEVFQLLRGLKASFLIGDELLVLTFAGYISQKSPDKRQRDQLKFRKFKIDVMKSFLNGSIEKEPRAVFAESGMNSIELENEIESVRRKSCPKLIWIEDILNLKNESLQLLRKYTDRTNLYAEKNTLVVLSFDLTEENSGYLVDPTEQMRSAFKTEMIFDEVEPFLARVAENVIEYRPDERIDAEL